MKEGKHKSATQTDNGMDHSSHGIWIYKLHENGVRLCCEELVHTNTKDKYFNWVSNRGKLKLPSLAYCPEKCSDETIGTYLPINMVKSRLYI